MFYCCCIVNNKYKNYGIKKDRAHIYALSLYI